jgi:hypothetical protein
VIVANRARLAALACCLLALSLGAWAVDARSLWGDEAFSVWASKQSAVALIGGLDAQPPLYHLVLGATRVFLGGTVFAVRFVSLCSGIALVAVAARLGQRMAGSVASIVSALILATSPILIYFEQEARMYALAAALAGGAMLLAVVLLDAEREPAERASSVSTASTCRSSARSSDRLPTAMEYSAYAALSLGALFTHYYSAGIVAVNALALGWAALRSRRCRQIVAWTVTHGAIAGIFGAWFIALQSRYVVRSAGAGRIVPPLDHIVANAGRGIEGLLFGMRADDSTRAVALAVFALAAFGLVGFWNRGRRGYAAVIGGWIGSSLGIVLLTASPAGLVPDFSPRYFLFALLPVALATAGWTLLAVGRASAGTEVHIQRTHGHSRHVLTSLIVAIPLLPAVYGLAQLFDAGWAKSQYAALINTVRERAHPGDGAILVNSDQFPLLDYYGPTGVQTWIVPNGRLSRETEAVAAELDAFVRDKPRVWLVNYGWAQALQPRSIVEQRLNARGARTYAQGFEDASLALYDMGTSGATATIQPRDIGFGEQIRLVGVRERSTGYLPGDALTLDLVWRADRAPQADYTVFMHLRRAADGGQIAAFDSPPVNGAAPTSGWAPGATITDTRALQIPADAAPGQYDVVIGWYQYPSFERLRIDGQDATEYAVSRVTISPP